MVRAGDRIVLANGALFDALPAPDLLRCVTTLVPSVASRRIIEAVEQDGRHPFVSLQIIQFGDLPGNGPR